MKELKATVRRIAFGALLVLSIATLAEAQATRTWVSGVGDDANPCSRTAPCKTFAGAISKTAAGGYINALDPAGFGGVTITKSITIDGGAGIAGVLVSLGQNGIVISGNGIKVTLRNLDIEGVGTGNIGVNVLNAAVVHIDHCHITDFAAQAINQNPSGANAALFVDDTTIKNTAGINIGNSRAMLNKVSSENNTFGVRVFATSVVTIRDSYFAFGTEGILAGAASAIVNVEHTISTHNQFGVDSANGATIRLSNSSVFSNSNTGLFNGGGSFIVSEGGNSVDGNPTAGAFTSLVPKQ